MQKTFIGNYPCEVVALRNGKPIGVAERITYVVEGDSAIGTVSFKECDADPRGCDLQVTNIDQDNRVWIHEFKHVELSSNLYLETPIIFVTDAYSEGEISAP